VSIRSIVVVSLALISGGSAAMGIRMQGTTSNGDVETVPVVIATVNLARGRMVTGKDVKVCQWPKHLRPEGAIATVQEAADRAAMSPMVAGEPILGAKLAAKDAGRGLAALVPKGMRAYTIQVSRGASGVAGFILPGNKVDVLLNLRGNQTDENGGGTTMTLLQSVEILAVDQQLDAPAENKINPKELSSVTLLVTPEQAAHLDLGQSTGQLTLALRNPEDVAEAGSQNATLASIRGDRKNNKSIKEEVLTQKPAVAPEPRGEKAETPEVCQIVTLRGIQRGLVVVTSGR
jgi:pilus assembly protein CpaB